MCLGWHIRANPILKALWVFVIENKKKVICFKESITLIKATLSYLPVHYISFNTSEDCNMSLSLGNGMLLFLLGEKRAIVPWKIEQWIDWPRDILAAEVVCFSHVK